ncbi:MAG: hypothetical protein SynsKO_28060 [Synoicihabitans sp.]
MKKPATWQFMVAALLFMAVGAGVTYWVQSMRLEAQFAARVPDRPQGLGDELGQSVVELEKRIRQGDALAVGELGELYQANGQFEPALAAFLRMTELDPGSFRWPMSVATMELALGKKREAKTRVARLRMKGAPEGEDYWKLGNLAEALGEQVDAKQDYERAVELDPSLTETWSRLITMYQLTGRTTEARAAFEKALDENPQSLELLVHRASFRADRGQIEPAISDLKKAITVAPENVRLYVSLSRLLTKVGQSSDAENVLVSFLERDENNVVALQELIAQAMKRTDRKSTDHWLIKLRAVTDDGTLSAGVGTEVAAAITQSYRQVFGEAPPE